MFHMLANTADAIPSAGAIIATLLGGMATGIGAVWTWFRGELNDCKADRKTLFARVEELHDEISSLSMRVRDVEREK